MFKAIRILAARWLIGTDISVVANVTITPAEDPGVPDIWRRASVITGKAPPGRDGEGWARRTVEHGPGPDGWMEVRVIGQRVLTPTELDSNRRRRRIRTEMHQEQEARRG